MGSPSVLGDPPRDLSADNFGGLPLLSDAHDLWPEFIERVLCRSSTHSLKQVRFGQTSLAIDAAAAGQGLAVASRFLVEEDIRARRLVQAFPETMRGRFDSYVVTPRKPRYPEPTEAVRQWLLARARNALTT